MLTVPSLSICKNAALPQVCKRRWVNIALARYIVRVPAQATITVEALHDGIDFSLALTRAKFEELNQDLFKKTLDVRFHLELSPAHMFTTCGI